MIKQFKVKVCPSKVNLPKEYHLTYIIAKVTSDNLPTYKKVADILIDRIIDNVIVATRSFLRQTITTTKEMALAYLKANGVT